MKAGLNNLPALGTVVRSGITEMNKIRYLAPAGGKEPFKLNLFTLLED